MKYGILLLLLAAAGACSQGPSTISVPTSSELGLEIVAPRAAQLNNALLFKSANAAPQTLRIRHHSLEKSFLYIAAIMETSAPDSHFEPFQPRLVQFKKVGSSLILVDVRPRQRYTEDHLLPRIIVQFPIVNEDTDGIEFDFANGIKSTFTLEKMIRPSSESILAMERPEHSYINRIFSTHDVLILDHHFTTSDSTHTLALRHIFKTESPSMSFSKEPDSEKRFGFFATPPWYEYNSATPHHYITRWALQRPISVALSPNIPIALRPIFEDAILSWNKALDHEFFTLSTIAADRGPLDFRFEVGIHWIDHDDEALARGLFYPHPVTGEIVHGDVMFQSGWYTGIKDAYKPIVIKTPPPSGFESAEVCQFTKSHEDSDQEASITTSADLQASLTHAVVRHVLIHELGHILGLRHNFAGSLDGELTTSDSQKLWNEILYGTVSYDHPLPSSSVMDYLAYPHDILMSRPGPYDVAAIRWGYFSEEAAVNQPSFRYCSDESTKNVTDCQLRDAGNDPLDFIAIRLQQEIKSYVNHTIKNALAPISDLEKQPVMATPSIDSMMGWLTRLHNYFTGNMVVWALNGKTPHERAEKAYAIWKKLPSLIHSQELSATLDSLELKIKTGDLNTQSLAEEAQLRIQIALKKLQMLLDLPPGSLNKTPNGTTADSNYGD